MRNADVLVSQKYQIVVPSVIREAVRLRAGDRLRFYVIGGVMRLVPARPLRALFGTLPELDADGLREEEERL